VRTTDSTGSGPDEVPDEVIAQAKAAFARRHRGEIAILTWDSVVDENTPARNQHLRFEHRELEVDVRIRAGGGSFDLEGQVKPSAALEVELQSEHGEVLASRESTDGTFTFDRASPGLVRLSIRGSAGLEISTDWFRI
jgi:hypothetical protein